jgi:hypothetical protein
MLKKGNSGKRRSPRTANERRLALLIRIRNSKRFENFFASKHYEEFKNRAFKIFEEPEGKLVASNGPAVAKFVRGFKGSGLSVFEKLGIKIVVNLLQVPLPANVLAENYAKRSAEEILSDKRVFVSCDPKKNISGCVDYTHVAIACARKLGFKALFYRAKGHSKALVFINGKFYFWDPMILLNYGLDCKTLNEIDANGFDLVDISKGGL